MSALSKLDLVFVMDTTGSMSPYITAARRNIQEIVRRLSTSGKVAVRFGLVAYRDHPPQDSTYITRVFPFTSTLQEMQGYLDGLSAEGGGDGPEALTAALAEVEAMGFRPDAAKVVVMITDAPPHGAGELGDGFPEGDPEGRDPLVLARHLASSGVVLYSVGCEPELSRYHSARGLLVALAQTTGGQAIGLGSAALLAEVILGGSLEEVAMQALAQRYESQVRDLVEQQRSAGRDVSSPEVTLDISTTVQTVMQAHGCEVPSLTTDGRMVDPRAGIFAEAASLKAALEEIRRKFGTPAAPAAPHPPPSFFFPHSPGYGASTPPGLTPSPSATHCSVTRSPVSLEQCARLVQRSVSKSSK